MKTILKNISKIIVGSLRYLILLTPFMFVGLNAQTNLNFDTLMLERESDTLLSDFDKARLYISLSKTFDKTPEKSLKYDTLGINLAAKNNWTDLLINASINYATHLNKLCYYKQADSALSVIEAFINQGKAKVNPADYYYQKASNYYDWSRYQPAKAYYEKALAGYKKHKNKMGMAKTLKGLGVTFSIWSDFESSIGYLQQARNIYIELGDKQGIESINLAMGVVMEQWGKIDVALNYYENGLSYFEEKHDIFNQANLRLHIGDLFIKKGNYNKALSYYFAAENLEKQQPHRKLRSIILSNIAEAYYFKGKYRKALEFQGEALKLKYKVGDRKQIAITLIDLGKIHLALKNYKIAVNYASKGYKVAKESLLNSEAMESLHLLSEGYFSLRKFDSAYLYLNKYIILKDKIYNENNTKTLNNLQIKYSTHEKEKENQLLKLKNTQNELLIRKERDTKYLLGIVIAFIILIGIVIFLFLRARNKQNRRNNYILEHKNAEITKKKEELSKSRAEYMSIVENATIGMYRTTKEGDVLFANKTLLNMIRSSWDEIKKVNLNLVKPDRKEILDLVDKQQIVTGREDIWNRNDGTKMFVNESMWIVYDANGIPLYYEGIVEDITKRKIAENKLKESESALKKMNRKLVKNNKELEKARIEIEKAYKTKSEFLANISHEIRTPLNAIIGFTDLLVKKVDGGNQLQYVQAIRSSGRNLLSLINDILDISKIQAGKVELHFEPVLLSRIVDDIRHIFSLSVKEKGLEFKVKTHASLTKLIFLDDTRIRQILFNLVGNALKFTDKGFVELVVDVPKESKKLMDILITIRDTGQGIPLAKQSQVFDAFVQSDSNKNHGGSGLGLSITKRLIEIMNGTLSMQSALGKGTTFTIKFFNIKIFNGTQKVKKTVRQQLQEFVLNDKEGAAIPDVTFSKEEFNRLAHSDFAAIFSKKYHVIQKGHVVKDIILYCEDMNSFAQKNSFKKLSEVTQMLKNAASNFDIEKMKLFLQVINELLIKIENYDTK